MHVSFRISDETVLMGCDTIKAFGRPCLVGNNISISINTKSEEEAKKLFAELSVGGQVTMTLDKIFWGALFGMFTDQFGIN